MSTGNRLYCTYGADAGCRILDAGYWIGDFGLGILDSGYWIWDWGLGMKMKVKGERRKAEEASHPSGIIIDSTGQALME